MTQYIRYCVKVDNGGNHIDVEAHDIDNTTIEERGGDCRLGIISARITDLDNKIRRGKASEDELNELGELLFNALFPAEITTRFRDMLVEVTQKNETILRLELDLDDAKLPQIAFLPWELLRAPMVAGRAVDNLGTHPKIVISRRRKNWNSAAPVKLSEPLRILLVVSAPQDIKKTVAWQEVETAIQKLANKHPKLIAQPNILHNPDILKFEETLKNFQPHLLHFIGHGRLQRKKGIGELALVRPADGSAKWCSDEKFGELFQVHSPSVVLLQACESAASSSARGLVGVASHIVQRNVPVVVAMQYPISNMAAVTFVEEFYQRLGELKPVDMAVQMGRRVLRHKFSEQRDFAAPVLFMRVKDGQLFSPLQEPNQKRHNDAIEPVHPIQPKPKIHPFPDEFCEDLPHPIAWACHEFNQAANSKDQFCALDWLLVNFTKYLMAVAISQYWQDNPDQERLRGLLSQLDASRLMSSLEILNAVSEHYASMASKFELRTVLFDPYQKAVNDESSLANEHQAIHWQLSRKKARLTERTSPQTLLKSLLKLRETAWESDPSKASDATQTAMLPILRTVMEELIHMFRNLLDYPLYLIENQIQSSSQRIYTRTAYRGASGLPEAAEPFSQGVTEAPYRVRYLYLWLSSTRALNLHPFLIEHWLKLYYLERGAEKGNAWYRACTSADRYNIPNSEHFLSGSINPDAEVPDGPVAEIKRIGDEQHQAEEGSRITQLPLNILLSYLSKESQTTFAMGLGESLRIGQKWLGIEFLLMGMSKQENSPLAQKLDALNIDGGHLRGVLRSFAPIQIKDWRHQKNVAAIGEKALKNLQEVDPDQLVKIYGTEQMPQAFVTPRLMQVLRYAVKLAGDGKVSDAQLLFAILLHHQCGAVNLLLGMIAQAGCDPREWIDELKRTVEANSDQPNEDAKNMAEPDQGLPDLQRPIVPPLKGLLGQIGRDLTALAQAGKLHPAIGDYAHNAMVQIGLILQQTQSNNPILLGDPGVGKTAIVEGLAYRLATEPQIVPQLANKRIVEISITHLLAGTQYRGDLEKRLQQLMTEVKAANGQIILFIDEIHTILGGKAEGSLSAISDALKPALARGELPCIGATTVAEYRRHIESDPALARRFMPVWINEPGIEDAIKIVQKVAQDVLAKAHGVIYPNEVVVEAVKLSVRYLYDEFLPSKAIKLLDQAGPRLNMGMTLHGAGEERPSGGKVTSEIVHQIVSERTGVPLTRLEESDNHRLLNLGQHLRKRVKGQDEAINTVAGAIKRARVGVADPNRPIGVFLFAGPTGVGKTELALALADALFGDEDVILRLDMSEYMEKHQIARLIGAPPGYVGYGEEGQLTGHLRRRPYSVVLLDEMEKAHPDVQHLFLQLFDAGRITDSFGNLADGRNTIFIMTTNLGAREAMGFIGQQKPYREKLQAAIEERFSPEFVNRIDRIIYFEPLTSDLLESIFDKLFAQMAKRFAAQQIQISVTPEYRSEFCKKHLDINRGARPLQRAIDDELVGLLTDKILTGEIRPGSSWVFDLNGVSSAQHQIPPPEQVEQKHSPPPLAPKNDNRDSVIAQNRRAFDGLFREMVKRLKGKGLIVEITDAAREFLCDPFWTESSLEEALLKLVEKPIIQKLETHEWKSGDQIKIDKYADHLEFYTSKGV